MDILTLDFLTKRDEVRLSIIYMRGCVKFILAQPLSYTQPLPINGIVAVGEPI